MIKNENTKNEEMNSKDTIEEVKIEEANKVKSQWLPSKMMLMIRLLLGVYLIYTAYELINPTAMEEATNQIFNISFAVLFVIAGIILLFFSSKSLKTGKYLGGSLDNSIKKEIDEIIVDNKDVSENK